MSFTGQAAGSTQPPSFRFNIRLRTFSKVRKIDFDIDDIQPIIEEEVVVVYVDPPPRERKPQLGMTMLLAITTLAILIYMLITFCCSKKASKGDNNSTVKSSDQLDQGDSKEVKVGSNANSEMGALAGNLGMM